MGAEKLPEGKVCTKCGIYKSFEYYHKDRSRKDGTRPDCKECWNAGRKKYLEENKEWMYEKNRKYHRENREKINQRKKGYLLQYYQDNKDKCKMYQTNRRKAFELLPNTLSDADSQDILSHFSNCCSLSGANDDLQWDHVIPISIHREGTTRGNVIPLSKQLNQSKKDSNIFEWFKTNRQRFNITQERFDHLIEWLGKANDMTVEEYKQHVYWCHNNPRSLEDLEKEANK